MGTFFSTPQEPSPPEAGPSCAGGWPDAKRQSEAASEPGTTTTLKSPTTERGKRDGRSYSEVVRAGPETGSMSELRKSRASWKFVAAPTDEEMPVQERLPDPGRDRQGPG